MALDLEPLTDDYTRLIPILTAVDRAAPHC